MKRTRLAAVCALLTAIFVAAGCTQDLERVTLPPEAPMEGIRRIAVVGFGNYTVDPGLGHLFEQMVMSTLARSERYDVVDGAVALAALAQLKASPEELATPSVAKALGELLNVDAIITGAATYYFENTRVSPAECYRCGSSTAAPLWSVDHETMVQSSFQARVIRARDGIIIWSNVVEGRNTTRRTIYLDWHGQADSPPSSSLVPRPDRRDIPATREASVREAVGTFTKDLLPREVWVRKQS